MARVDKFSLVILLAMLVARASIAGEHSPQATTDHAAEPRGVVRLAVVNTPVSSGLLAYLLPDFEQQSGYSVKVYGGNDVYDRARAGEADIVISHYGKTGISSFVMEGYGEWPKMVFSNQSALIGHRSDPAKVTGLGSTAAALKRIASSQATFIHNNSPAVSYLTEVALATIGQPERSGWFRDKGWRNAAAAAMAEETRGYFIWGAVPFLRYLRQHESSELEILVADDPALQRVMAAIVVSDQKLEGINSSGAEALLAYLLAPATQAKIAAFRMPGIDLQLWWPAGRDN
jgi:tungstate transport system substrate-binding protein